MKRKRLPCFMWVSSNGTHFPKRLRRCAGKTSIWPTCAFWPANAGQAGKQRKQPLIRLLTLPDNRLKTITDRQKWVFNEENPQNLNWKKDGSSLHRYRISGNRQMEQLSGHIRQFLEYLATERNGSPHTIAAYRNDLKQFESFVRAKRGEKATINDLDHLLLRLWLADLSEKRLDKKTAKNR